MRRLLVVSPHLDDAVLSVGQVLAGNPGAVVVTVFAGVPDRGVSTSFDRACGFPDSRQAMRERRAEDERALEILDATPVHLDFQGQQYGDDCSDADIAEALAGLATRVRPAAVLGPLGLVHPDHERVARVWPGALAAAAGGGAFVYAELPYAVKAPRRAGAALRGLAAVEADLTSGDVGDKAHAMLAYTSQLRYVFPLDCLGRERLWRLEGPGAPGAGA